MIQLRVLATLAISVLLTGLVCAAQSGVTYDQARWDPIHFKPALEAAPETS